MVKKIQRHLTRVTQAYIEGHASADDTEMEFSEDEEEVEYNGQEYQVFRTTGRHEDREVPTFLICPPILTECLMDQTNCKQGIEIEELYDNLTRVVDTRFATWRQANTNHRAIARNIMAVVLFLSLVEEFLYTAECQGDNIFIRDITPVSERKNRQLLHEARQRNGLTLLEEEIKENKENNPLFHYWYSNGRDGRR